jgi:diguanylate cyclase (GGDEF)-like protein/PAS domain S-box-containing protein
MAFLQGSAAGLVPDGAGPDQRLYDAVFVRLSIAGEAAVLVTARDVTLERAALDALVKSRALHRDLMACSSDFAFATDAAGVFTYVNRARALGFADAALHGRKAACLSPDAAGLFCSREAVTGADAGLTTAAGDSAIFEISAVPVFSPDGVFEGARGIARDVTALRQAQRAAAEARDAELAAMTALASIDALTGCLTRTAFETQAATLLAAQARGGQTPALLYLDIDRFKVLNDTRGHGAGDAALGALGRLLTAPLRSGDLAVRFGGDEFGLLLANSSEDGARARAVRLLADARACRHPEALSLSIGIALARPGEPLGALTARADAALYTAKRAGRGQAAFAGPETC